MSEEARDQPTSGRLEGRVHHLPVRIYYEDTDFTGVVYHARYLHFLERARTDFLRTLGIAHAALLARPEPLVVAVTRMTLVFKAPARIDDALVVRSQFLSAEGARLHLEQDVVRGDQVLLAAEVEAACLTPQGRPRRAPADVVALIAPLAQGGVGRKAGGVPK
jgi:acyl-CoA thioester hydrolase